MHIIQLDHIQLAMPEGEEEKLGLFMRGCWEFRKCPSRKIWRQEVAAGLNGVR